MNRTVALTTCVCLLTSVLLSQSDSENTAISQVKRTLASQVDSRLPKVSLEYFLSYEAGGSPVQWEVNDCNTQVGPTVNKHEGGTPVCVEADFDGNRRSVNVFVSIRTANDAGRNAPAFFDATVTEIDGSQRHLRQLADLPAALHRPMHPSPRDIPD